MHKLKVLAAALLIPLVSVACQKARAAPSHLKITLSPLEVQALSPDTAYFNASWSAPTAGTPPFSYPWHAAGNNGEWSASGTTDSLFVTFKVARADSSVSSFFCVAAKNSASQSSDHCIKFSVAPKLIAPTAPGSVSISGDTAVALVGDTALLPALTLIPPSADCKIHGVAIASFMGVRVDSTQMSDCSMPSYKLIALIVNSGSVVACSSDSIACAPLIRIYNGVPVAERNAYTRKLGQPITTE